MNYQSERTYGCRIDDSWTYRGLKTAIMENKYLRIVILLDKGADIYQFIHKSTDVDFMWRSPWGVRDPSQFLPTSGSATSMWLDVYEGGWQTVLPGGGYPSEFNGAEMGLHAEVNMMPWDYTIVEDTPERISLKCSVRTYRTPFFFEKTLTLTADTTVLEIEESLVNEGEETTQCVWGQHIALGAPFLSEECVIDLPGGVIINHPTEFHPNNRLKPNSRGTWPWTEDKAGNPIDLSKIPPKSIRAYDQSYISNMSDGWYAVTNQKLELGWGVVYPKEVFPYLWYWQSLGGGFGYPWYGRSYNIGLEPFTSYTNEGLTKAVENGTALQIDPGQRIQTSLKAIVYTGAERVKRINFDGTIVRQI